MFDSLMPPLLATGTAFCVSVLLTQWLAGHGVRFSPIDHPNARSLHSVPVPRSGGLAVLAGVLCALLLLGVLARSFSELAWILAALIPVAAMALLDDFGGVSRRLRLLAQASAALLLFVGHLRWQMLELPGWTLTWPSAVALAATLVYVIWLINLYNFMDGMDGLAGGMAVFGFAAFAILGWSGGEPLFAFAAASIALAAAGFLSANFPPARIFLGDAGSSSLGLLVAAFSLWGSALGLFPLWSAWLLFSPFILDATWTLLARLIRGERIWEPHRSHHYQRLVLAGWSHRRTLMRAYVIMATVAACAVASPRLPVHEQWMLIGAWAVIYAMIHVKVRLVERADAPASN
ncbi:glycosyl transferase [Thiocapsa imhoffii]|uniref:Glycosyl transferase n=1 Tax=Thiocapsa imhoffii TaxID=382777 RepID=A0A9X0WI67_9GAMM|nr:glycosyltransferase family 4 protein [Thiocapsa imhoffii]MBK1645000.1 glycosyl transferase [Thiocapsa imhoffii]